MRYSVIEHPQFSERSTRRFFSSALNRRVTVDHFPEALLGFLPLGFLPLTTPLPALNNGLSLLHGVVPTTLNDVQHRGIPTAVPRPRLSIVTLKETTVEPATGRAFPFSGYDTNVVHSQNLPQISFGSAPARRERKVGSLFFAGSFHFPEILSQGDKLSIAGYERKSYQFALRTYLPVTSPVCPQPVDIHHRHSFWHTNCRVTPHVPGDTMTPWWHSGSTLVGNVPPH